MILEAENQLSVGARLKIHQARVPEGQGAATVPPRLPEGQTPRPLQEKATRGSAAQSSHRMRAKPWARMPQGR
jgi:hypothetical protein